MTRQDIENAYEVRDGIICSPGKFEGEAVYAPYFWEAYLNGGEDIDLCFRARAAGRVNAVALRSVVGHHVSSSPGRKARDEQNSFLLARRWQREFIAAADFGRRAWCHSYLEQALLTPQSREFRLAIAACFYLARFRTTPPPEADAAIIEGAGREWVRWETMFGPQTGVT